MAAATSRFKQTALLMRLLFCAMLLCALAVRGADHEHAESEHEEQDDHGDDDDHDMSELGEWYSGSARIFVADNDRNSTRVLAIDLPAFQVTSRISVPGSTQTLGLSDAEGSHRFMAAFLRTSGTKDEHYVTFINTGVAGGLDGLLPAAGSKSSSSSMVKNWMRKPVVTKSVLLVNGTDIPGGVEYGSDLVLHPRWGLNLMFSEVHGRIIAYKVGSAAQPDKPFTVAASMSVPPGHFHVAPLGNVLFASHTGASKAFMLDRQGKIAKEFDCAGCHGSATHSTGKDSGTAIFGCNSHVLAVTVSARGAPTVTRIGNNSDPRPGTFLEGVPGVFWTAAQSGSAAAAPYFYRTDIRKQPFAVTKVNHPGTGLGAAGAAIRMLKLSGTDMFVAIHRNGLLVSYNGLTGAAKRNVTLASTGFPATSTTPYMTAAAQHGTTSAASTAIYISVPGTGNIHEIILAHADGALSLKRTLFVGGFPESLVVASQHA